MLSSTSTACVTDKSLPSTNQKKQDTLQLEYEQLEHTLSELKFKNESLKHNIDVLQKMYDELLVQYKMQNTLLTERHSLDMYVHSVEECIKNVHKTTHTLFITCVLIVMIGVICVYRRMVCDILYAVMESVYNVINEGVVYLSQIEDWKQVFSMSSVLSGANHFWHFIWTSVWRICQILFQYLWSFIYHSKTQTIPPKYSQYTKTKTTGPYEDKKWSTEQSVTDSMSVFLFDLIFG